MRVDDVDPNGKVSLSLVTPLDVPEGGGGGRRDGGDGEPGANGEREYVSFEDSFDSEIREEFGDLGPEPVGGGGDRTGGEPRPRRRPGPAAAARRRWWPGPQWRRRRRRRPGPARLTRRGRPHGRRGADGV